MVEHPAVNGRVAGSSPALGGGPSCLQLCICAKKHYYQLAGEIIDKGGRMKKLVTLGIALLIPSITLAAGNHPMGGCGLGYLLMSNKDNDKVTQVLGATTNGTFGSQ